MSVSRSCVIREFPVPDREYRAAGPARWSSPPPRRPASRVRRRKRKAWPLALAGLALFAAGFLLGRAGAVGDIPSPPAESLAQQAAAVPEEPMAGDGSPVRVLSVPGTAASGEDGEAQFVPLPEEPEEPAEDDGTRFVPLPEDPEEPAGDDWRLILVSTDCPLPEDFQVPELTRLKNGHAVDSRAYPELQRMMDDCRAAGLEPLICSSYRSLDKQSELFEKKVQSCLSQAGSRQEAEEQAAFWVARPGESEHHTALALDIVDKSYQLLDEKQEDTAVQRWLMAHCAEYGFILRYPTEKSALTGVGYEPWHYRYVGAEAAREIMSRGLCLEEYLGAL